jgi:Glycosyl transferase family 2
MAKALSVTAVIAAYNEEDVIGAAVGDLLDQGIRVHLLDHGSTDGTVAEVERLRERGVLTIERLDGQEFSLARIIQRKELLAAELDSDWFVNADADEFRESPWPGVGFVDGLREVDRLGYNAVDFAVVNFFPVDDSFRKGDDPRDKFRFCEPGGPFDRLQIRCWRKQPGRLDLVSTGGHEARFPGRRVFPLRFLLRHYPIRSQAHGERKVLRERLARFSPEERALGWHVQYDGFDEGSCFLRESSSLVAFDPWTTRLDLALRHRGVEALEHSLAERGRELEASRAAAGALGARAEQVERDLVASRALLGQQEAQVDFLRRDREAQLGTLGALRGEMEALRRELEALRRERESLRGETAALRLESADRRADLERVVGEAAERAHALHAAQAALRASADAHAQRLAGVQSRLDGILGSRIWKWTGPLRTLIDFLTHR